MTLALFQNDTLPVRRPSEDARQYAYRIIRKFILELLLPGQKMNEADLASSLNMSRTPIHDSFFKLSKENLVDVIPKRGAFVSKIDQKRIDDSVWIHQKLGSAMIHSIYIRKVPKSELELLYCPIQQMNSYMLNGNSAQTVQLLSEYYHQLYMLAGNLDLVWSSLQKTDTDLRRLLSLAVSSPNVLEGLMQELTNLTDALINRDYDNAGLIYDHHFSRIRMLTAPLRAHNPQYFYRAHAAGSHGHFLTGHRRILLKERRYYIMTDYNEIFSLKGKTALITGGTGGLGSAIARAFLQQGAQVAVCGTRPEKAAPIEELAKSLDRPFLSLSCDLTDAESTNQMLNSIEHTFGTVDILVNSAGINRLIPAEEYDDQTFQTVMDINIASLHRITREVRKTVYDPSKTGTDY